MMAKTSTTPESGGGAKPAGQVPTVRVSSGKSGPTKRPSVPSIPGIPRRPTPSPLQAAGASVWNGNGRDREATEDRRTLRGLMLFRVVLASVLLLCLVSLVLTTRGEDTGIAPSFAFFLFGLLGVAYLATIVYAFILPRVQNLVRFAYVQIGVDLLLITILVHATGGVQSAFTILFMIQIIAVALLPERYGAAYVAVASAVLVLVVSLAGYFRLLPIVPGQGVMPWELQPFDVLFRLVLNVAAIATMGALGLNLSGQTQRAGERLARHEQYAGDLASLHHNTIRCLSSGLVTVTMEGRITSINEAACDILGLQQRQALGAALADRIPGLGRIFAEAGPVGTVRRHETQGVRPDGSIRHLGISATPLSDHTGEIIGRVLHFQDLTELRRMQGQVERAERLASIGRLAAGIAHEIRNPLASISGSVEMLRQIPEVDDESRQLVDIAVREVDRLNRLITELLDYARPHAEERQPLDLGELATEIAKVFEYERREAAVHVEVEAEPASCIEAAAGQIRQVLWNLIRNAADAMPEGGKVRIRIFRQLSPNGPQAAPMTVLSVQDTGIGIKREDVVHIFEPFFSTKRGGTGLGLATVARIVEDHRGHIEIESTPGQGTEFVLRFPQAILPASPPTAEPGQPAAG
jgi:two-component system sensor histidine kinase PilS (NtrC family)